MNARMIRDLTNLLSKLEAERDRIEQEILNVKGAIASAQRIMGDSASDSDESAPPAKTLRNEMVKILQEEGGPLHYGEIYDRLRQRGISVPGKDPRRNIGAHLSNDERFESLGSGEWGLESWKRSPERRTILQQGVGAVSQGPSSRVVEFRDRQRGEMQRRTDVASSARALGAIEQSPESDDDIWDDEEALASPAEIEQESAPEPRESAVRRNGTDFDDVPF